MNYLAVNSFICTNNKKSPPRQVRNNCLCKSLVLLSSSFTVFPPSWPETATILLRFGSAPQRQRHLAAAGATRHWERVLIDSNAEMNQIVVRNVDDARIFVKKIFV